VLYTCYVYQMVRTSDSSGKIFHKNVIQFLKSRPVAEKLILSKTILDGEKNINLLIFLFYNLF